MANSSYSKKIESSVRNTVGKWQNKSNPNWRAGFPGERHMITPTGVSYSFAGPGTHLQKRLARNDPPLDGPAGIDACARIHDIEYNNARNASEIRQADIKINRCVKNSSAGTIPKMLVRGLMRSKMFGEDINLIKPQDITDLPNFGVNDNNYTPISLGAGNKLRKTRKKRKKKKDPAKKLRKMILN